MRATALRLPLQRVHTASPDSRAGLVPGFRQARAPGFFLLRQRNNLHPTTTPPQHKPASELLLGVIRTSIILSLSLSLSLTSHLSPPPCPSRVYSIDLSSPLLCTVVSPSHSLIHLLYTWSSYTYPTLPCCSSSRSLTRPTTRT